MWWFVIALFADATLPSCAQAKAGQPFATVRPAAHAIDVGVCGSDDPLTARPIETVIDRPRASDSVEVTVGDRWIFAVPATDLAQIHTVRAPAGPTRMLLRAKHFRDAKGNLGATRTTFVLRRIPMMRGRVLSPSGQPLQAAAVQPMPGTPCVTRFDGSFDCELADVWPRALAVSHANLATRVIAVDKSERDIDLGDVRMCAGARLSIQLSAPPQVRWVTIMLFRDHVQIAERHLHLPLSAPVTFDNLEPGALRILVKGSRPLQQLATNVTMNESDREETLSIDESELTMRVYSGARAEAGSSISLNNLDGGWNGAAQTDESGSATEPLWQLGPFTAAVRTKSSASPLFDHRDFSVREKQEWTFNLPIGRIEGVVRNEEQAAVANAEVNLTSDNGQMASALHTTADDGGHYAFDGVRAGAQTVSASADGYLPATAVQFRLGENEELRRADFTLHRGQRMSVDVVDNHGVPIANAIVVATLDNAVTGRVSTDANGRAALQLAPSGSPVLFVIPASGSFAIHRVTTIDRDLPVVRVMVADGTASLDVKTETTEHQPVRDVHFLVRYDGENIPIDILMELGQRFGIDFATGARGSGTVKNLPVGLYELWPFASLSDVQTMSAIDAPAPVRIAVAPGPNSATLTFRLKRR